MVALTPDALWIQDTVRLRSIALQELEIARPPNGAKLAISPAPPGGGETLTLTFDDATQAKRWYDRIQACQSRLSPAAPSDGRRVPEVVALVRRAPDVAHVSLGRVRFLHGSAETADQGVQLRAGILGADAVIDLRRKKCPEIGSAARQVTGLAVRVEDEDDRKRLRGKWYAEQVAALTTRMLLLVGSIALLQFLVYGLLTGKSKFIVATGESLEESMLSAGLGTARHLRLAPGCGGLTPCTSMAGTPSRRWIRGVDRDHDPGSYRDVRLRTRRGQFGRCDREEWSCRAVGSVRMGIHYHWRSAVCQGLAARRPREPDPSRRGAGRVHASQSLVPRTSRHDGHLRPTLFWLRGSLGVRDRRLYESTRHRSACANIKPCWRSTKV